MIDYELIYKKLKKTLKDELYLCKKFKASCDCEKLKNEGMKELLEWLFKNLIPEIEGKKHQNLLFHKNEFEEWKKEIDK